MWSKDEWAEIWREVEFARKIREALAEWHEKTGSRLSLSEELHCWFAHSDMGSTCDRTLYDAIADALEPQEGK